MARDFAEIVKPDKLSQADWNKLVAKRGVHKKKGFQTDTTILPLQHKISDKVNDSSPKKQGKKDDKKSPKNSPKNNKVKGKGNSPKGKMEDKNLGSPKSNRDKLAQLLGKDTSHQVSHKWHKDHVEHLKLQKQGQKGVENHQEHLDQLKLQKAVQLQEIETMAGLEDLQRDQANRQVTNHKWQDMPTKVKMAQKQNLWRQPKMARHGNKNSGRPTGTDNDFST